MFQSHHIQLIKILSIIGLFIVLLYAALFVFPDKEEIEDIILGAWTYEQNFNTLNDGGLNSQDGWLADPLVGGAYRYDVTTSLSFEGAKSVYSWGGGGLTLMERDGVTCTDGDLYIAAYMDTFGGANQEWHIYLRDDSDNKLVDWGVRNNGTRDVKYTYDAGSSSVIGKLNDDRWYVFHIEFNTDGAEPGRFRLNWTEYESSSWEGWTAWRNPSSASFDGTIDDIMFFTETGYEVYFDTISASDPSTPPAAGVPLIIPNPSPIEW